MLEHCKWVVNLNYNRLKHEELNTSNINMRLIKTANKTHEAYECPFPLLISQNIGSDPPHAHDDAFRSVYPLLFFFFFSFLHHLPALGIVDKRDGRWNETLPL